MRNKCILPECPWAKIKKRIAVPMRFSAKDLGPAFVGALATLPQAVAYGLIAVSPLGPEWAVFGIMARVGTSIVFGIFTGALSSNPFLVSGP